MSSTFSATHAGHDVVLEFDTELDAKVVVLHRIRNHLRLLVDGELVDAERVFYGTKELGTRLPDGTEVAVSVHSGMVGEPDRPQLRGTDGTWIDMVERSAPA